MSARKVNNLSEKSEPNAQAMPHTFPKADEAWCTEGRSLEMVKEDGKAETGCWIQSASNEGSKHKSSHHQCNSGETSALDVGLLTAAALLLLNVDLSQSISSVEDLVGEASSSSDPGHQSKQGPPRMKGPRGSQVVKGDSLLDALDRMSFLMEGNENRKIQTTLERKISETKSRDLTSSEGKLGKGSGSSHKVALDLPLTNENLKKLVEFLKNPEGSSSPFGRLPSLRMEEGEAEELRARVVGLGSGDVNTQSSSNPFILLNSEAPHQLYIPVSPEASRTFHVINLISQPRATSAQGGEAQEDILQALSKPLKGSRGGVEGNAVSSGYCLTSQTKDLKSGQDSRLNSISREASAVKGSFWKAESSLKNLLLLESQGSSVGALKYPQAKVPGFAGELIFTFEGGENRGSWAQSNGLVGAVPMEKTKEKEGSPQPIHSRVAAVLPRAVEEPAQRRLAKFHPNIGKVGDLEDDGHVFVKSHSGGLRAPKTAYGKPMRQLVHIHEAELRHNMAADSVHYQVSILSGTMGLADGFGFVIDNLLWRRNVQTTLSIYLNSKGEVCKRKFSQLTRVAKGIPPLQPGIIVNVDVNLTHAKITFTAYADPDNPLDEEVPYRPSGLRKVDNLPVLGSASCNFHDLVSTQLYHEGDSHRSSHRSGYFCAVLSEKVAISLY